MQLVSIAQRIAELLSVNPQQVQNAIDLLDEGSTVPFIARYRKERTGGLDDGQLRTLSERLIYIRELDERRAAILKSIEEQGKLEPKLKLKIEQAQSKTELEDLYLPYKKKRRTKAQIAREAGLEPLAMSLLDDPKQDPAQLAAQALNPEAGFSNVEEVLDGAKHILSEVFAEDAEVLKTTRDLFQQSGFIVAEVQKGKESESAKYNDYIDHTEALASIPSHRILALLRARNEGVLSLKTELAQAESSELHPCESLIARRFNIADRGRPADKWLLDCTRWAWKVKLSTHLDVELKTALKTRAEVDAIEVFAKNLRDLLLAAPAGAVVTMGLDPGLRTGVKVAVVDQTGKLLDTATIYPHAPKNQWRDSLAKLALLVEKHQVRLLSIGNGTASRETDKLAADLIQALKIPGLKKAVVSEAGASVYSASETAAKEFPELDVSLRGAVSIARRLQDPLAELVKIEPKAIGVGQYQHDVSQTRLAQRLSEVVEDCVNAVGVDVNRASVPLLTQVAGLTATLAENIVQFRNQNGAFLNRQQLLQVPRMGPKAYEQAAGFLRIGDGDNPLDNSAVHPEAYPVVNRIQSSLGKPIQELMRDSKLLRSLDPKQFTDENFGVPTVIDIISELEKPGRDPRPEFKMAEFRDDVESVADLKDGMRLEGVITNVTDFGAFVDIGVHQDGLIHISMLADKFVKDPREIVKAGDIVTVYVVEVDQERQRIALSMRAATDEKSASVKPASKNTASAKSTDTPQSAQRKKEQHNGAAQARHRNNSNNKSGDKNHDKHQNAKYSSKHASKSATKKPGGKKPSLEQGPINTAMADALRRSMAKK